MNKLISGGAKGADKKFENLAKLHNHDVMVYRPEHFPKELIKDYDKFLNELNDKYLSRKYPTNNEYVNNLLRRDVLVGLTAEVVYAISGVDENNRIMGGTAWACYSFISKFIEGPIQLYLFDQYKNWWYQIHLNPCGIKYIRVIQPKIALNCAYAGIGTRELNENGISAINLLYS
jgi:hypothetical protein